jgi:hypothetical protein
LTNPEREHRLREEARAQAVAESGFSEDTIRRHIAKGALPIVRRGSTQRIRILRSVFDRYLLNQN